MIRSLLSILLPILCVACAIAEGGPESRFQTVTVGTNLDPNPVRVTINGYVEFQRVTGWTPTSWLLDPAASYIFTFEHTSYKTLTLTTEVGKLPAEISVDMQPKE